LWVDTHPDINTPETTPSGNLHGMTVAHLLGLGDPSLAKLGDISPKIKPENIIFLGLRWVDPPEVSLIRQLGITAYTMHEIDRYGIGAICEKVFTTLNKLTGFVLSFDLDVCDPAIAPGVGTPVRGGLTFRESHLIMEMAAECPGLTSVDIVEYNPDLDVRGATRELVAGMIESVTGKKILPTVSI
jgi:arginase